MPELPEIVAHAERLAGEFAGAGLSAFRPLHISALKTYDPRPEAAVGRALSAVGHRGKYLLIEFAAGSDGDEDLTFVVHLMQGGRLRPDPKRAKRPRGGLARWELTDGRALLLTEAGTERKAGVWMVAGDPLAQPPVDHLGPDAHTVDRARLGALLAAGSLRLHGFLREQRSIAGLGRLLANEILWEARLSPFATTTKLAEVQVDDLHEAIRSVIGRHLEFERGLDDIGRSADRPSVVHQRVGESCPRDHDEIRSVEYRRYTVAYCPTCQTGGRVLADNTTSKFLK